MKTQPNFHAFSTFCYSVVWRDRPYVVDENAWNQNTSYRFTAHIPDLLVYTVLWLCQLPGYDNYAEGSTLTWSSSHERFTVSNVESQVFTPNNSRLPARGSNAGRGPRPKRATYHWTTAPFHTMMTRTWKSDVSETDISSLFDKAGQDHHKLPGWPLCLDSICCNPFIRSVGASNIILKVVRFIQRLSSTVRPIYC